MAIVRNPNDQSQWIDDISGAIQPAGDPFNLSAGAPTSSPPGGPDRSLAPLGDNGPSAYDIAHTPNGPGAPPPNPALGAGTVVPNWNDPSQLINNITGQVMGANPNFRASGGGSGGSGGPGANNTYGNDPNATLLMNTILQRLQQLQKPVDTTAQDAYAKMALDRVTQLGGAPFSDQQTSAMLTQNMGPLTQTRDTLKQQKAEELSRRGIGPTSGVFIDAMNKIDQAYQRGVAGVTNTLNIQGIDQATKNQQMQLSLLSSIVDMNRATAAQQEGLSSQLVPTAATGTNFDNTRLATLTNAGNSSDPTQLISSLVGLGNLGLNNQSATNTASAQSAYAMAQMIYALMNGAGKLVA